MKKVNIFIAVFMTTFPFTAIGVTPVHVGMAGVDTSTYEMEHNGFYYWYVPSPFTERNPPGVYVSAQMIVEAFLKKNSNQFDFYSFSGKIGTSVIPIIHDSDKNVHRIIFSCGIVDDDDGWESIVSYINETGHDYFKVFDNDGTELLADSGSSPYYGFDGNSTYVLIKRAGYMSYDCWRFRTNISSQSPKSLSKTRTMQSPAMQIYGLSDGNYKVSLVPSSGNQVSFQMFDLMGRCVFSKQLENLKSPVTFTIPESNVPNSPFIAKVKDGNETLYKKQIPVK